MKKFLEKINGLQWAIWTAVGYFVAIFALGFASSFIQPLINNLEDTLFQAVFNAIFYIFFLLITVGLPILFFKMKKLEILKLLGLERAPKISDLGNGALSFLIYYGILFGAIIIISLISSLIFNFDFNQIMSEEQEVGFSKSGNNIVQLIIIFFSVVIIPAVCEETIMRGFLYGKLRKTLKFLPTALITSLLFAVMHWQISVGIDTFVLSMVLCKLREYTGSIWAGIFVHMLKNGLAFVLLFTNLAIL